ncbi:2-hydroxy-6-oxo-6-phenylhexa-2,4-dienoate hydrolase [Collibacillus ludicampi]|jgi:3-oxoadipate enol-lactonase|uniref:2-hydroxy-6-oxo-6-phenylhexa-2,4-dienoate hydrolase n=1 Tax=Collibacillus ludicampi TaxID=2771369 RepID=A0AAV4LEV8_9BACL|nr:alpha/beta hydrolase [Collibacillus ludicampi]GIM46218.1 2-hydroxy-6-oxo-6-phenylhexa-2,4-dienoate hydrolase [Collibacillus ludicampi]
MYQARINGITMYYNRIGSGEPLVLIHGLGERKESWVFQYALSDNYDLIIPDLRGHGQSETTEDISIETFAHDILSLLDHLGIESAHFCGLSMGGAVTQEIYRLAPERCRSLILVNTFFFIPITFKILMDYICLWKLQLPKVMKRQLAAYMCLYTLTNETLDRFTQAITPNMDAYAKSVDACLTVDNRLLLRRIKVPTLIIGSQYDRLTPAWMQVLMHQRIPHSELVILRRSGHLAKLERPEEFNGVIRSFLERQQLREIS